MGAACGAGPAEGGAEQEAGPSIGQALERYKAQRGLRAAEHEPLGEALHAESSPADGRVTHQRRGEAASRQEPSKLEVRSELRELTQRLDQQRLHMHAMLHAPAELAEDAGPPAGARGGSGAAASLPLASGELPAQEPELPQAPAPELRAPAPAGAGRRPGASAGRMLVRGWQPSALAPESDEEGSVSEAGGEASQGHRRRCEHVGPRGHEAWAPAPPLDSPEFTVGELAKLRSCAPANSSSRACQAVCTQQ